MLGQNGEARRRVLSPSEAQQGESRCYAAMHNASQNYDLIKFFDSLSRGGKEEQEKEEEGQEEEVGEAPGLPPTPGGRKGTSAKQADGGACCPLPFSFSQNHL